MSHNAIELLKERLQKILLDKDLSGQRHVIQQMADELKVDFLDYASALLYLTHAKINTPEKKEKTFVINTSPDVKMVRYRLNVGSQHHITIEELKQVLVDESGVDKKYLNYINIQPDYTLVDLPDAMPADIFQHLKSVEINQQKLGIKRLKMRNFKKRNKHHLRRGRIRSHKNALNTEQ